MSYSSQGYFSYTLIICIRDCVLSFQVKTVCQAMDLVCAGTSDSPASTNPDGPAKSSSEGSYAGAFCVIRPPGHHCAQDVPSGQVRLMPSSYVISG